MAGALPRPPSGDAPDFKQQACDFALDKDNMPENSILYMNQGYQSWKDNKKTYYADYYIFGQVNEKLNPPEIFRHMSLRIGRLSYIAHDTIMLQEILKVFMKL